LVRTSLQAPLHVHDIATPKPFIMDRLNQLARQLTGSNDRTVSTPADRQPLVASRQEWDKLYEASIRDPAGFWAAQAKDFVWFKPWEENHHTCNNDLRKGPIKIEWFKGAKTNVSYNCLDRWVAAGRGAVPCFIFEGNTPGQDDRQMTFQQVLDEVCRVACWLREAGVRKGDTVTMYCTMGPELPIAMLACARIGAVHSVVFGGFSADSLGQRIVDSACKVVVTMSGATRGAKALELKKVVDAACDIAAKQGHTVSRVLVWEDAGVPRSQCTTKPGRDVWWQETIPRFPASCAPEWMDAEDRLFLLYTSGSTGKPKGVVHTTGGYMVGTATTMKYTFDARPGDVYFSTADCGWITGHSYGAYGPLLCGVTSVILGGTPTFPDASRVWQIVAKHKVSVLYTAPTLLRTLLQQGDHFVTDHNRSSLRILATVGEPIGEHAWKWYHSVAGDGRCPIIDTWWQTETGSFMLTPQPQSWCKLKPGCASLPFLGVNPVIMDANGKELTGTCEGILAIKGAWPAMARTLHGDHKRFEETYFGPFPGYFFTGDGARRDEDGYIWITGRVDDVINVSGHRIGTAEVESAITEHESCAESAVIGLDHPIKGQAIYAYVTLVQGAKCDDAMKKILIDHVRASIGPFAAPEMKHVHWAPSLPKTRSGKIMRRILRKIAMGETKDLGDLSTLAEPAVVEQLISLRGK